MIKVFLLGIFSFVFKILKYVFNFIIKIVTALINGFNLSVPFLYILFGLLLHLSFNILERESIFFAPFHFGLVITFGISIITTIKKFFITTSEREAKEEEDVLDKIPDYYSDPHIFRVKNNPQYIVYEFYDKYQLFKETPNGLEYIRTDLKKND